MTTDTTAVQAAQADITLAEARLQKADEAIEKKRREIAAARTEAAAGADALAAEAAGADEEFVRQKAREIQQLENELAIHVERRENAAKALERAKHLTEEKQSERAKREMKKLLRARKLLGVQTSLLVEQIASNFADLMVNGRSIVSTLVHKRGVLAKDGYLAFEPSEYMNSETLGHMLQMHLGSRIPDWHYPNMPPFGGRTFGVSIEGSVDALQQNLDLLGGFGLAADDEAIVAELLRAEDEASGAKSEAELEAEYRAQLRCLLDQASEPRAVPTGISRIEVRREIDSATTPRGEASEPPSRRIVQPATTGD